VGELICLFGAENEIDAQHIDAVIYVATDLGENKGTVGTFIWSALSYIITQCGKFVLLALMSPFVEYGEDDLREEFIKAMVNIIDVLGIYLVLSPKKANEFHHLRDKILAAALGWGIAEFILKYLLYFIMNATENEIKWVYLQTGIFANFELLEIVGFTAIIYILTKTNDSTEKKTMVFVLILLRYLFPVISLYLQRYNSAGDWESLAAKAAFSSIFFLSSLSLSGKRLKSD